MRLLVANFFPANYPPSSGGEQRYYCLYHHLSRWHDVTLFSANYTDKPAEIVEHSPSFREYRVPKPPVSDKVHWELYESGIGDECSAYVVGISGALDSSMRRRFRELVQYADAVVHESPFTFPLDESAYTDGKPRIYASYNVEHRLAAQILQGESGRAATRFVRFLEAQLVDRADLVFATSEEEREVFAADFTCDRAKLRLAPNGFEPKEAAAPPAGDAAAAPYVVFLGSGHPPNVEAARFICTSLAPIVPDLEFRILGSVCKKLGEAVPPNVRLLGFVDDAEMRSLLAGCAAALNPLFSGAGTNLKMLQYMECGAPILSTAIGARGLDLEPGVDALIRPSEEFPRELQGLAASPGQWRSIGAAGRAKAYGKYSWPQIAQRYSSDLATLPAPANTRRRLLHVNDFPVTARRGGGEVRIFELLRELSEDFEVELLCFTDEPLPSDTRIADHARQRAFPKTAEHREAERTADEGQGVSVRDIVASEWLARNEPFMDAFRAAAAHADIVVFEHSYMAPLVDFLPAHARVIYSSLNIEEDLKGEMLRGRADDARWIQRAADLERKIAGRANAIIAVSHDDARTLRKRNPGTPVLVVENGVAEPRPTGERPVGSRTSALFMGSSHLPNIEAARYIVEHLAPSLPSMDFHLIGSVGQAIAHLERPANVICHGVVSEEEKAALMGAGTIAINPMASGGGSSLKVPDYLAAGMPLISTHTGARGFGLRPGIDYVEADSAGFREQLDRLSTDRALRARIAAAGQRAIQLVTWPVLGARYRRFLRKLLARRTEGQARVLVVTYRIVDPAPGGAESYLNHLLAGLVGRDGISVDVAACDVGSIHNHWHFSARYGPPASPRSDPQGVQNVFRFPVDPPDPDAFSKCRQLFSAWMRESRLQWKALFEQLESPFLLGGWNFPESECTATRRWSSLRAQIGVVGDFDAIRVEGTTLDTRRVALVASSNELCETQASGPFALEAELPPGRQIVELTVNRPLLAADDPRELGASVQRVSLRCAGGRWVDLDLADDAEKFLRRTDTDAWIESLIAVTEHRGREIDDLFFQVRGPHSLAMREWLQKNAAGYDAVIVQGAPFAPLAWVPPIARHRGVPVALLPHFHVEDRYYHWKGYYREFRNADCVLAAPASAKAQFFDKIDAHSEPVPGGGIDLREYESGPLTQGRALFRQVHRSTRPFALVLGRKAGGKRYDLVLEAARSAEFDVVMIGPDDDGRPVSQPAIHCYGSRPRDFVIGALADCTCLVNMSESESFGIVLLEAWAAGHPVVAQRRCVAFTDLVRDGENGFLAESSEEIRECIRRYVADPELAQRHAAAGKELAQRFSWASLAARVHDIVVEKMLGTAA